MQETWHPVFRYPCEFIPSGRRASEAWEGRRARRGVAMVSQTNIRTFFTHFPHDIPWLESRPFFRVTSYHSTAFLCASVALCCVVKFEGHCRRVSLFGALTNTLSEFFRLVCFLSFCPVLIRLHNLASRRQALRLYAQHGSIPRFQGIDCGIA